MLEKCFLHFCRMATAAASSSELAKSPRLPADLQSDAMPPKPLKSKHALGIKNTWKGKMPVEQVKETLSSGFGAGTQVVQDS